MHAENNTSWVPVRTITVGDRIRVPGYSSWSGWASREDAERSEQPFRVVESVEPGSEGSSRTRFVFESGGACQLPPNAGVLRLRVS